jgi:signal transduction histidine kinase
MVEDLAKIAAHLEESGQPLWLWEPKRRRIIWANRAGREFWGAQSLFDLAARSFASQGSEARAMARSGADLEAILNLPGGRVSAVLDIAEIAIAQLGDAHLVRLSRIRPAPRTRSGAHSRDLFQSAPIGLCLMDPQGHSLDENSAWAKLAGGPRKSLTALAGEKAAARFLLACITNTRAEFSVQTGSKRLRLFGKCLKQSDGSMPLIYVRGEDVTVEHALEMLLTQLAQNAPAGGIEAGTKYLAPLSTGSSQAARSDRAGRKDELNSDFISLLGQEMRNPLQAIIGFSEIMRQAHFGPLGNARYEAYSRDIHLSAENLLKFVNDLLDLVRIEAGQRQLDFDGIALEPLIDECLGLVQPEAMRRSLRLKKEIAPDLPDVTADARSLRQLLHNLLSNAVNFTGENGHVSVSAALDDDGALVLGVADSGIGMSEGEVQLALEPLGQIEAAEQGRDKGPGLGLPIARALAEANMAAFHVASEPQHGTRVEIRFPPERLVGAKTASSAPVTATG